MPDLTIITNNVPRDVVEAFELSPEEREEFDYIDWAAVEEGSESASFVRYRGELYDLSEFEVWRNPSSPLNVGGWQGMRSDSYFSGLLVRYVEDFERVIVGRYYT